MISVLSTKRIKLMYFNRLWSASNHGSFCLLIWKSISMRNSFRYRVHWSSRWLSLMFSIPSVTRNVALFMNWFKALRNFTIGDQIWQIEVNLTGRVLKNYVRKCFRTRKAYCRYSFDCWAQNRTYFFENSIGVWEKRCTHCDIDLPVSERLSMVRGRLPRS